MRRAMRLVQETAPEVYALLEAEDALMINLYGEHLAHICDGLAKYADGDTRRIVFLEAWEHRTRKPPGGAGMVVTAVIRLPEGRKAMEYLAQRMGGGSA